ncbi:hypothetical protein BDV36DRAFT_294104 [Aspergillus pseudocaelatus]|uniref:Glycine zipper 2TM domain-containing protein n=1 Tax=Aspergillus pseudocaelatus TaxID=1825620 RepID=A0ABQ6WR69_9EURO|nr:hypothetical protein BDV36DRAFT_294104 [Aspergillus pseudocaelatus]
MANRDYYGNNVPLDLVGEQESRQFPHTQTQTQIQSQDSRSNLSQVSDQDTDNPMPAPNTTQHPPYEQDQTQLRDPANPEYGSNSAEGEKGLGSTIVGGAGGAFVGHEVGKKSEHGILGTIGGAIAGAIAANIASHAVKDHGQDHGHNQGTLRFIIRVAENLQDFDTVTDGSLENEAFARVRINIILQAVLRERRPFAASQARTLHLGFETPMSITLSQTVVISGKADYSLWYTSHEDRAHQLIIVEAKKARHVTSGLPQLLGYMGAVQLARRTAQKSNIAVFGVLTDAYQWDFVRVHNDGKYSLITFRWNAGQSQKIWDILNWMVAYAEVQSPLCSELS